MNENIDSKLVVSFANTWLPGKDHLLKTIQKKGKLKRMNCIDFQSEMSLLTMCEKGDRPTLICSSNTHCLTKNLCFCLSGRATELVFM